MQFVRCMKIGQLHSAVVLNLQPLGINGLKLPLDYGTEFVVASSSRSHFLALAIKGVCLLQLPCQGSTEGQFLRLGRTY